MTESIATLKGQEWPANRDRDTFWKQLREELRALPVRMGCRKCGQTFDAGNLTEGRAWWKGHDCL